MIRIIELLLEEVEGGGNGVEGVCIERLGRLIADIAHGDAVESPSLEQVIIRRVAHTTTAK